MAIFDVLDDTNRGMTGEYGQLNVYDDTLNKYVLLLPLETLPSVVGSTNTVDNDVTTSRVIGKIKGKKTIDDKDITFLWHRDNIERLNEFVGKQCDFLVSYKDGTGWKFSGEITYRNDDGSASDKLTGTLTIIASDVDDIATSNVLDMMAKTCVITNNNFPSEVVLEKSTGEGKTSTKDVTVKFSNATATCDVTSDNTAITATYTSGKIAISTTSTTETTGIVKVVPKASGEASWTQYILVVVK